MKRNEKRNAKTKVLCVQAGNIQKKRELYFLFIFCDIAIVIRTIQCIILPTTRRLQEGFMILPT